MFEQEIINILKKETKLKEIKLEIPPNQELGDYAFPCFELAKIHKRNPVEIAQDLIKKIKLNKNIQKIEAKGPYLNFFIKKQKLTEQTLKEILKQKDKYGSKQIGKGKKALIEHTSINPNASPHVGRARNAIIGDSLTKILKFQGYKTEVHYFVNDIGKQIAMLVYATKNKKKFDFHNLLHIYIEINKKLKDNDKIEQEIFELLHKLEKGDSKTKKAFQKITNICIKGQSKIFSELNIKYDFYDHESKYLWDKKLKDILKKLENKTFKDENNRIVLDQQEFNLPMKVPVLVLTRNDGTSLYPLRDIAYHIDKASKGKDLNVLVLGEDHKLYYQQLKAALSLLKIEAPKVIHYSFILLKEGKMSTREGKVVLLEDFMKQAIEKAKQEIKKRQKVSKKELEKLSKIIGYGALKYSIIKVSPDKNVTFDWDSALNFDGESAPYIQYAHARIASILKKYKKPIKNKVKFDLLNTNEEINLIKKLSEFPNIVETSLKELKPYLIANYAYDLSSKFNEFYHNCNILKEKEDLKEARLLLIYCVKQVIKNSLALLNIETPNQM